MVVRQLHATPKIPRKAPELDVVAVRAIGQRFVMHHRQRYLDALGKLDGRKREILAALPMFFHCNHPLLPGYLRDAPSGIWGHVPSGADLASIHRFARSFDASLKPARQDIDAICLMGSGGSLGHTADSDIDLWVCCDEALHEALLPKLRTIEQWADQQGLAVQGFLVDPAHFRDPANTTHGPLLLDEFYRSGIHLTGKVPLWWYVSGTTATEYEASAKELFDIRFVRQESVLDFGPVGQPDLATLCAAGMTELGRALQTPHKSLLKLALVESYLNHPERPLLSSHYHHLMRTGVSDITRLDTYYMLFDFLSASPTNRLSTFSSQDLREMFVRKIVSRGREIPRSSLLASEIRMWGFTDEQIQSLRHPQRMTLTTTLEELKLSLALQHQGIQFGRRLSMLSPRTRPELMSIESTFESYSPPEDPRLRPMNPALLPAIRPQLEIRWVRQQWRLMEGDNTLRAAGTWAELLLWLTCNGIECQRLQSPTAWFDQATEFWLEATNRPFDRLLFFNPLPDPNDDGDRVITAFDDPLSYSGLFICKARMVWCVERSLDQFTLHEYRGESGVLEALVQTLQSNGAIEVAAATYEDKLLVRRVISLLHQSRSRLETDGAFELAIGRSRYVIKRSDSGQLSSHLIPRAGLTTASL